MISRAAKVFSVELKKKISSIFDRNNLQTNYSIIFYITNVTIVFCMLHDCTLDEFMPDITEQMQRLFYLTNLRFEDWNESFHYNTQLWRECCHPFNTEFHFCKENVKEEEWTRDDEKVIKSFVLSL